MKGVESRYVRERGTVGEVYSATLCERRDVCAEVGVAVCERRGVGDVRNGVVREVHAACVMGAALDERRVGGQRWWKAPFCYG